jgi:DNA modification methylase
MPTLQFKGKNTIWNHHLSVPYHALEAISALAFQPEKANGNLIVEGDNLLALKALLPLYAGQVKCIYIDPPYNTGNESWVYNDNANSPLMKDWLGKEVGKDDLTRHDKWLCMMTPRLKLLRDLLSDDGAIFISIDDNEVHHLRALMDEMFGDENFIATVIWHKMDSPKNTADYFSEDHDYIVIYAKNKTMWLPNLLPRTENMLARYKNPDNDPRGDWLLSDLAARNFYSQGIYSITTPSGKVIAGPPAGSYWRVNKEKFDELDRDNRIWWGNGDVRPGIKRFLSEVREGIVPQTIWHWQEVGSTRNAKQLLSQLLEKEAGEDIFSTPKPPALIKRIIHIAADEDSIVLDSFAGSGTTAQAVLDLNKEDGGNRKFILVQMSEAAPREPEKNICQDITRERVKRAIEKFGYESGFEYLRVGVSMDAENLLEGHLPSPEQFGRYVYYLCTGAQTQTAVQPVAENLYLAGTLENTTIYFIYSQNFDQMTRLALNLDMAEKITASARQRTIVYAPACFLDEDYLREKHLEFVNIPYGLFQRKGDAA